MAPIDSPAGAGEDIAAVVRRFAQAWQAGRRPSLGRALARAAGHPRFTDLAFALARTDLNQRVIAGDDPPLEDVLGVLDRAGVRLPPSRQVQLARMEYDGRWWRGEPGVSRTEYQRRFPECDAAAATWTPRWTCPACDTDGIPLPDEAATEAACPKSNCANRGVAVPVAELFRVPTDHAGLDGREYAFDETADLIAEGGMGGVYRSRDPGLGRELALKVIRKPLHGSREAEWRFVREAKVTARLEHPNIVPVHSIGRLRDGRLFYTMKLVRGQTLEQKLAGCGAGWRARLGACLDDFERVCQAVAYAHRHGVTHRDLKPANLMVGEFGQVQVMDWGLAKRGPGDAAAATVDGVATTSPSRAGESVAPAGVRTQHGRFVGTLLYAAPEQVRGEAVGPAADVFALGAVLCEILTGRPPYLGTADDADGPALRGRVEALAVGDAAWPGLERLAGLQADAEFGPYAALGRLAEACFARDAAARPADAGAVAAGVEGHQSATRQAAEDARVKAATLDEERKKRRFARLLAISLAVLLVGAVGAAAYYVALAGRIQTLADDNQRKADDNRTLADDNQRTAKEAQDQRDAANRHLARVYFEKADRAGLSDALGSRLLFAKSLTLDDDPETRRRLLTAQSVPVRLLWSSLRQPVGTLLAASPDGRRVVAEDGRFDGPRSVVVWDAVAGREVASYPQAAVVARWSPDGRRLATADARGNVTVRRFDGTAPPLRLRLTDADADLVQHRPPLLAFTPAGDRLTILSPLGIEGKFVGCQWDVATGAVVKTYRGQPSPRFASAWVLHPDGRHVALALHTPLWERQIVEGVAACVGPAAGPVGVLPWLSLRGQAWPHQLVVWDLEAGAPTAVRCPLGAEVRAMAFADDGSLLALGGDDGRVRVLDSDTGTLVAVCRGHIRAVDGVAFGPRGGWMASAGDGTTRVWDPRSGQERHRIWASGPLLAAGASALWIGNHGVWDALTGQHRLGAGGPSDEPRSLTVSPNGRWVAAASLFAVHVWDAATGAEVLRLPKESASGGTDRLAFNAAGTRLIAVGNLGVRGWDVPSGTLAVAKQLYYGDRHRVSWPGTLSGDHKWLFALGPENQLEQWEVASGNKRRAFAPHEKDAKVYANGRLELAIRSDEKLLLSSTGDHLQAWDIGTGKEVPGVPKKAGEVRNLTFVPGSPWCFWSTRDGAIQGWDTGNWKLVCEWDHPEGGATCLAVHPAGTLLASGAGDGLEFPMNGGQSLAVGLVVRPLELGRGNVPQR